MVGWSHAALSEYVAKHEVKARLTQAVNSAVAKQSSDPISDISLQLAPHPRPGLPPAGRQRKFLGGNWKCKATRAEAEALCADLNMLAPQFAGAEQLEVVLFVPTLLIDLCSRSLGPPFVVGAQSAWEAGDGARSLGEHTGSTTAAALRDFGCSWLLLGHSDRRNALGESSELIAAKTAEALRAGLCVNLTIGETKAQRDAGEHLAALESQLSPCLDLGIDEEAWSRVVLAYEPVWAIGDGATPCTPESAQEVHAHVRAWFSSKVSDAVAQSIRITYTGSVSPSNAAGFSACADVDGFVCGRAALVAADLLSVAQQLCARE